MYEIVKARQLADKIYLMDVKAPRVARACQPGEFVIVKTDEAGERIPLTICDYDRETGIVTIVFQVVGVSTQKMAALKAGDSFRDFVGPLGRPSEFVHEDIETLKNKKMLFVAGGVGAAPVYPQVKWLRRKWIRKGTRKGSIPMGGCLPMWWAIPPREKQVWSPRKISACLIPTRLFWSK